jgi:hypothetical protein
MELTPSNLEKVHHLKLNKIWIAQIEVLSSVEPSAIEAAIKGDLSTSQMVVAYKAVNFIKFVHSQQPIN